MQLAVFHFLPDLHVGGVLRLVQYNATALKEKKIRNVVVYFNENHDGKYLFEKEGIELLYIPYNGVLSTPSIIYKLYRAIQFYDAKIVHSHLPFDCRFSWMISFFTRVSIVMTLHFIWDKKGGTLKGTLNEKINKWFFFQCMKRAKGVIAVSNFVKQHYPTTIHKKIELIYSGIVDNSHAPTEDKYTFKGNPKLICVGRSHAVKGHAYFVDLMKNLKDKFPGIKLYIFTKNPEQSEYGRSMLRRIQSENLSSNIQFIEDINDPKLQIALYKSGDCFVFPSIYESLPLSILEALSFGLPVVASSVGGIPEVISEGYNGYLFPVGDMNYAARLVEDIVSHPAKKNVLSQNARRTYEANFQVSVAANKLLNFYQSIINH